MCKNEQMLILLSGHLDGCNTPEEEARLEAHLAQCPDCRTTLEEYRRGDALLASLRQQAPADFTANVMRAVEAEPRKVVQAPKRKWHFGYATAVAAIAAVVILAAGSLPGPGAGSAKLSMSADLAQTTEEAPQAAEPEAAPFEAPQTSFAEAQDADFLPANVDCAALARAEHCPVGLIYADPSDLGELSDAPSLPLSGGVRYSVTQKTLDALRARYEEMQVYEPEGYLPADDNPAYLIVAQSP